MFSFRCQASPPPRVVDHLPKPVPKPLDDQRAPGKPAFASAHPAPKPSVLVCPATAADHRITTGTIGFSILAVVAMPTSELAFTGRGAFCHHSGLGAPPPGGLFARHPRPHSHMLSTGSKLLSPLLSNVLMGMPLKSIEAFIF